MAFPRRKPNRLRCFDYSSPGAYFITICTQDRKNLLCHIVGGGAFDAPGAMLTKTGRVVEKYILSGQTVPGIHIDKYVIMPNHIHLIVFVEGSVNDGTSKAPSPTNAVIPHFVSTLKRFCHREIGTVIFQRSYHDHIIRSEQDYLKIWEYIDSNPSKWKEDCFYQID